MRSILSAFPVPEVHFQCLLETETFNFFFLFINLLYEAG